MWDVGCGMWMWDGVLCVVRFQYMGFDDSDMICCGAGNVMVMICLHTLVKA